MRYFLYFAIIYLYFSDLHSLTLDINRILIYLFNVIKTHEEFLTFIFFSRFMFLYIIQSTMMKKFRIRRYDFEKILHNSIKRKYAEN